VRGIRRLFRFPWRTEAQIREEVDVELTFHLAMRTESLERSGLSAEDARREALHEFGDVDAAQLALVAYGRRNERQTRLRGLVEGLWRDTKYSLRSLRRGRGFTVVAVLVLSLGIGVNSAAFDLINLLLGYSVSITDPERVVGVYSQNADHPGLWRSFSYPEYEDIREHNRTFAELAAFTMNLVGVGEGDTARRSVVGIVSANYFRTFGEPLARGRDFDATEERSGAGLAVAVVSYDFWQRRGGDPNILGSNVSVNGERVQVIGVAAKGFTGSSAIVSPDLWLPLGMLERLVGVLQPSAGSLQDPANHALMVFGRLNERVSRADADADLRVLTARIGPSYRSPEGELYNYSSARLPRLDVTNAPEADGPLLGLAFLLVAMSGIVLLIACLNLASLFLARGATRSSEIAIRQSLGSGRGRLVRQLLIEGALLAVAGGICGFLLAYVATEWLLASLSAVVPLGVTLALHVRPQPWVFAATVAACLAATLLFGLGPALKLTGNSLSLSLKEYANSDGRRLVTRFKFLRTPRSLLIVAQIALSLMLLTAGGLFVRGALVAAEVNPGFSLDSQLVVGLDPSLIGYKEQRSREIYAEVLRRLRALPEVGDAALASLVPLGDQTRTQAVQSLGAAATDLVAATYYVVSDDYFESLRLPLLRGRGFTDAEAAFPGGSAVAIIDQPLAQRLFGEADAVGKLVRVPSVDPRVAAEVLEIVGIVPGTRHRLFDQGPAPHLYVPFGQHFQADMYVHVRVAEHNEPVALLSRIRDEIRAVDPALPVLSLATLYERRDRSVFLRVLRVGGELFATLGILALLLAVVGVYGVKAFTIVRRTREIGVRMALGATSRDVVQQMVSESLALTIAGLAIGLVLAFGIAQLLRSLLFEVSAVDPIVFLSATMVLATAATLAAYLPARRASRIEPTAALRHE